jgi:hypothetical protein
MRKSERLRILELEMVRLVMMVELLQSTLENFLDIEEDKQSNLDSGKWYNRKMGNNE